MRIEYVNCGFLLISRLVWEVVWKMMFGSIEFWFYLYDNVGIKEVDG